LAAVRWPGRLEIVQAAPLVILDGAHNVDGVATLVRELPSVVGDRTIHLLFGVMRDKNWLPMVEMLGPRVGSATVTTVLPPRGQEEAALAAAFARYCPVRTVVQARDGLVDLLANAADRDAILVTGSLFLVGQVYPHFLHRNGRQSLFGADTAALPA
jgi:dihydrofolate synthase/folylpolyglutamate synthase